MEFPWATVETVPLKVRSDMEFPRDTVETVPLKVRSDMEFPQDTVETVPLKVRYGVPLGHSGNSSPEGPIWSSPGPQWKQFP
ncbi:hypothetical protein ACOMHN_037164 [Nucella lapillus]